LKRILYRRERSESSLADEFEKEARTNNLRTNRCEEKRIASSHNKEKKEKTSYSGAAQKKEKNKSLLTLPNSGRKKLEAE